MTSTLCDFCATYIQLISHLSTFYQHFIYWSSSTNWLPCQSNRVSSCPLAYAPTSWRSLPVSSVTRSLSSDTRWFPTSGLTLRRNLFIVHTVTTHRPSKVSGGISKETVRNRKFCWIWETERVENNWRFSLQSQPECSPEEAHRREVQLWALLLQQPQPRTP